MKIWIFMRRKIYKLELFWLLKAVWLEKQKFKISSMVIWVIQMSFQIRDTFKNFSDLYMPGIYYDLCYIFPGSLCQLHRLSTKFWPDEFLLICSFVRRRATACLDSLDKPDNFLFFSFKCEIQSRKIRSNLGSNDHAYLFTL